MTDPAMQSVSDPSQPIVRLIDGALWADSRDVATFFRKKHFHVLEAITALHCSAGFRASNFRCIKINDLRGESTSHVEMTRDGFAFLGMGFTGPAAAVFKESYIGRFNAMEAALRQQAVDPVALLNDPVALRGLLAGYSDKVLALEGKVAAQAPKIEAHARLIEADGSLCVRDAAKTLQIRPSDLKRYLVANRWIYKRPGCAEWIGYQAKVITGLITHKAATIPHDDGHDRVRTQVRITPKGLSRLAEEFALVAA